MDLKAYKLKSLLFSGYTYRNCSAFGWLSENGTVDDGFNDSKPIGYTHFRTCFDS